MRSVMTRSIAYMGNGMQAALLEPAFKGTLNVLESCAKARPKRIVLTSSVVSVLFSPKNVPGAIIDETFFTEPDVARKYIPVQSLSLPEPFYHSAINHESNPVAWGTLVVALLHVLDVTTH